MALYRTVAALLVGIACAGCGGTKSQPPPSPPTAPEPPQVPPFPTPIPITGSERIAWDQQPMSGSTLQFAGYLDTNRVALPDVQCRPRGDGVLDCSAQLPPMSLGLHLLRIAAIGTQNGRLFESSRSEALILAKTAALSSPHALSVLDAADAPSAPVEGQFVVERIASTSRSIADLAVSQSGQVFAAERLGRVLLINPGATVPAEALELRDVATTGGRGLFSIALHPDFETNGLVYFLYAAETAADPMYRIARGRAVGGRIGEIAVLLDAAPAAPDGWGVLRFGPDRRLYVALADDAERRGGDASYTGKLLRFDDGGRSAGDNPAPSPIVARHGGAPLALLWTAERTRLILRRSRAGSDILLSAPRRDAAIVEWAADARPAALAFLASDSAAGEGHLYAGDLGGGVRRIAWPPSDDREPLVSDAVVAREYGAVRAVASAPDGAIYFGTANIDLRAPDGATAATDFIVRIVPPRVRR